MEQDLERRIAAELRAELARQEKSRHWLADQTGIPVTTVARWLRGSQSPRLNDLDAMCRAFGMGVADLLAAVERNGGYQRLVRDRAAVGGGAPASLGGVGARSSTDRASDYGSVSAHFSPFRVSPLGSPARRDRDRRRRQLHVVPLRLVRDEDQVPA